MKEDLLYFLHNHPLSTVFVVVFSICIICMLIKFIHWALFENPNCDPNGPKLKL
jgi:hypothetical protein